MEINIKAIEDYIGKKEENKKKYNDITFLIGKNKFHLTNFNTQHSQFLKNQETTIKQLGEVGSNFLHEQIQKLTHMEPHQLLDTQRNMTVRIHYNNVSHPVFYEFDTIMIDSKRVVEYFVKFLAGLISEKEPDSIENFFQGLLDELETPSKFCEVLSKNYVDYTVYLTDSWKSWIKELNGYRTDTMHRSINIKTIITVTMKYGKGSKIEQPHHIEINGLLFKEKDMLQYINNLHEYLMNFYLNGLRFIEESFCKNTVQS